MGTQLAHWESRDPGTTANIQAAVLLLRSQCRAARFDEDLDGFVVAMGMLAEIATKLWDDELASAATAASQAPSEVPALHGLGRKLVDCGLFDLAVPVLLRANRLEPGCAGLLTELAVALEADGRSELAMEMLLAQPKVLESSFLCRHLLAHDALMAGYLQAARGFTEAQLPMTVAEAEMAGRVLEMTDRADGMVGTTPLDDGDLRGWHFVTTGGILLHLSPYGQELGMRGRYGTEADCYERMRYCLDRLRWSLCVLGLPPRRVMAADDLGSLALAAAGAKLLEVPVSRIDGDPGLIIVHDTARLSDESTAALATRAPGQLLYAHATCWTETSIAPDFAGLLHQSVSAPWAQAAPRRTLSEPPMSRRSLTRAVAGPVADCILHARPGPLRLAQGDTDEALLGFLLAARRFIGKCCTGERPRMPSGGGPVKSPRV